MFLLNVCDTSSSDEFSDTVDTNPEKFLDSKKPSSKIVPFSSSHEKSAYFNYNNFLMFLIFLKYYAIK